jgi:hypothetical protein
MQRTPRKTAPEITTRAAVFGKVRRWANQFRLTAYKPANTKKL